MIRLALVGSGAYFLYPLYDNKIHFSHQETPENLKLISNSPSLSKGIFMPTPWLANGILQALFGSSRGELPGHTPYGKDYNYQREYIKLPDNGTISIDWAINGEMEQNNKILIISPGLTGGSKSQYIRNAVEVATDKGYRVAVVHGRGIHDNPLTSPKTNHCGLSSDLAFGISYIHSKYPNAPLLGLGTSMGGNLMLKYAGESGKNCLLKGISVVSTPYNLPVVIEALGRPWPYAGLPEKYLLKSLRQNLQKNWQALADIGKESIDLEKALAAKSVYEFDNLITCKIHQYETPDHYYQDASCINYMKNIEIPTFALSSLDDPVVTSECIPYEEFKANPKLILGVTRTGGHVGWFSGMTTPRRVRFM